jgi:hypothetical protein
MVRDAATAWLLEMNPRFPAWVHGATSPDTICRPCCPGGDGAKREGAPVGRIHPLVLEVPVKRRLPAAAVPEPLPAPSAIR